MYILVYTSKYSYIYGYPLLYHDQPVHSMLLFMVVYSSYMVQTLRYTEHKLTSLRCQYSKETAINRDKQEQCYSI